MPLKRSPPPLAGGDAGQRPDTTPFPDPQIADVRLRRAVARLHLLGPRVLAEFLAELGAARMVRTEIEEMLARYNARLDPEILGVVGGDRFPPIPLRLIAEPDSDG